MSPSRAAVPLRDRVVAVTAMLFVTTILQARSARFVTGSLVPVAGSTLFGLFDVVVVSATFA